MYTFHADTDVAGNLTDDASDTLLETEVCARILYIVMIFNAHSKSSSTSRISRFVLGNTSLTFNPILAICGSAFKLLPT